MKMKIAMLKLLLIKQDQKKNKNWQFLKKKD